MKVICVDTREHSQCKGPEAGLCLMCGEKPILLEGGSEGRVEGGEGREVMGRQIFGGSWAEGRTLTFILS